MSRFLITRSSLCIAAISLMAFSAGLAGILVAQDPNAAPNPQQQVSPALWQLLADWAEGSSKVRVLHGKHERHVYDTAFEVEKVSNGEFWYESPDKGRIDVQEIPANVIQKLQAERSAPGAKVERKKDCQPFDLKSDSPERWICDGQKVYDINDPQKTAKVVNLPPDLRGQNIMNSPLPFLFGLPPAKAVERFKMELVKDYRPDYDVVLLKAEPRWRQDAENWREAQIFLDTKLFLPNAVKLMDPAETKSTVYTFKDMEVNKNGLLQRLGVASPWDPKIDGYQIHIIHAGQEPDQLQVGQPMQPPPVQQANAGPVMPDVSGKAHDVATDLLLQAGIPRENISKQNAGPAPRDELVYRVRDQNPKPGTTLNRTTKIVLNIFDKRG